MNHFKLANFSDFLKKDTCYRLDFFRGVEINKDGDTDLPLKTIQIIFSEFSTNFQTIEQIESIPNKDYFKPSYKEFDGQNVEIIRHEKNSRNGRDYVSPVAAMLPVDLTNQILMKPGSVWKNGRFIWEPDDFDIVSFSQSNSSFSKIYYEQLNNLYYRQGVSGIKLQKFPDAKVNGIDATVLVPTMEINRFYFSGSRYFTYSLFNNGFADENIKRTYIYKMSFDEELRNVYIWMRRRCFDSDALLLARGIADKHAMKAMKRVYASVYEDFMRDSSKTTIYPETHFPFSNDGEIQTTGRWFSSKNEETGETEFFYLVYGVSGCDQPMPFNSIELESVDSYRSSNIFKDRKAKHKRKLKDTGSGHNNDETELDEGDRPDERLDALELEYFTQRFTNLDESVIKKVKKVSEQEVIKYTEDEDTKETSGLASTLPGGYAEGNDSEPCELVQKNSSEIPENERLQYVSSIIEKLKSIIANPLPQEDIDDTEPYGLYRFEKPKGKSGNYSWHNLYGRPRRALFLEINTNFSKVYLLEIEAKEGAGFSLFLLKGLFKELSPKTFLQEIAECSATGLSKNVFSKYFSEFDPIKHTTGLSDNTFAKRIQQRLMEGTDEQIG